MRATVKRFEEPDEVREMPAGNGYSELVRVDRYTVSRTELQPGWRWSNDVRPTAGTASCQLDHYGAVLEGRLRVEMDDGTVLELAPCHAYHIPPGHDAWVIGNERVRTVNWKRWDVSAKSKEGVR